MKAISLWQPWAWAILHAGKRIENRYRADGEKPALCSYRGPLLIHASKSVGTRDDFDGAVEALINRGVSRDLIRSEVADFKVFTRGVQHGDGFWSPAARLQRGGIVGRCVVIGHIWPNGQLRIDIESQERIDTGWHFPGSFGLVLADVEPLPFVPWKGDRGLFDVSPSDVPGLSLTRWSGGFR